MPPKQTPPTKTHDEHRKTPTQMLAEIAIAQASRPRSEPVSTVSLTLNAKGETQITVDVDDTDPAVAAAKATELFDVLCAKYPRQANGA